MASTYLTICEDTKNLVGSAEVSENPRHDQEPVSIDGAVYVIVDGEWTRVGFSGSAKDPDAEPFSLPDGQVSIDGAVFASVDGECTPVVFAGRSTKR
jgi:hypothetical protein